MDWWRSWHGAPIDPKWLLIARRAQVAPGMVSAVAWALFDYASQQPDRGSVAGFDTETYAEWAGWDEAQVVTVIYLMRAKSIITDDDRLAAWDDRQPKREDNSTERVQRWRDNHRSTGVTQPVSSDETQCNATQHTETLDKIREESDTETESPEGAPQAAPSAPPPLKRRKGKVKSKAETPEQVTWFRSVIGRFPPKELYPRVCAVVDARRDDKLLEECWQAWIATGYNPRNYGWFLDWYRSGRAGNGAKPNGNGRWPTAAERQSADYNRKMAALLGEDDDHGQ